MWKHLIIYFQLGSTEISLSIKWKVYATTSFPGESMFYTHFPSVWCSGFLLNGPALLSYLPGFHQKRSTEAAMDLQTYKLIDIPG